MTWGDQALTHTNYGTEDEQLDPVATLSGNPGLVQLLTLALLLLFYTVRRLDILLRSRTCKACREQALLTLGEDDRYVEEDGTIIPPSRKN